MLLFHGTGERGFQHIVTQFVVSFIFFQVQDVFWGWNNEVHMFDPTALSWTEPQSHVSASHLKDLNITEKIEYIMHVH